MFSKKKLVAILKERYPYEQKGSMLASSVTREHAVCKVDDMEDDEMREFEIANAKKVLVIKQKGVFTAVSARCSHYGAPLVKGALGDGRVRCPWHGACFNTVTGDIEDYPGLDSLAKYEVVLDDDTVKVVASDSALTNSLRRKNLHCKNVANNRTVLIIGAGAAAQTCAETLRAEGFTGRVVMATKEKHLPYDRPKLSKAMDSSVGQIALRDGDFYSEADIEILTRMKATGVDIFKKLVTFKDGLSINYDMLLISTGGIPVETHIKNANLRNVCNLRTPEEANYISKFSTGKLVVINGCGFISMETASFLSGLAASVTVISRGKVPFMGVFGEAVGSAIKWLFEQNGVKFYTGRTIAEFRGTAGALSDVVLDDGTVVPADVCVNGIGVRPSTDFVHGSGIPVTTKGFIPVDKKMRTEVNNVYAAGDIVQFPLFLAGDNLVNIGHWQMAHAHGKIAALNMLEKATEIRSVPYFWSVLFKMSIRYAGHGEGYDDVIIVGDLLTLHFSAYYTKGDTVVAVASMNKDPVVSQFAELLAAGGVLTKEEITGSSPTAWTSKVVRC